MTRETGSLVGVRAEGIAGRGSCISGIALMSVGIWTARRIMPGVSRSEIVAPSTDVVHRSTR